MKAIITALALAVATGGVFAQAASAAAGAKAPTAQQSKMGDCAKDNKGKKGQEYKDGMKTCLSAQAEAKKTQKTKMADCAKSNKGKKGQEYKDSMKACLSA